MAVPFDPTDPSHLNPEQRLDELAAILAAGLRRASALRPPSLLQTPADPPRDGLNLLRQKNVHASRVNAGESTSEGAAAHE
jgi:hypothetical protein